MKKLFALVLSAVLVLGLFAGCGSADTNTASTAGTTINIHEEATPAGTLLVSMGDTFELIYDDAGNLLQITGIGDTGKTIADACAQYVGRGCVFAVRGLLRYASDNDLISDAKTMAVRVRFGDPLPTEDFLDTIVTDTQYLADEESTGVRIIMVAENAIDENGLLTPETAKYLAGLYLGAAEADLTGADVPTENVYTFSYDGKNCTVDAETGLVTAK